MNINGAVLSVEGLEIHARLGFYEEERNIRQKFTIDLALHFASKQGFSIQLGDSVDYQEVVRLTGEVMKGTGELIENAAHRLGKEILEKFTPLSAVRVRIRKRPQVGEVLGSVSYECTLHK